MLSISPQSADIVSAVQTDTFVLSGWNTAFGGIDGKKAKMAREAELVAIAAKAKTYDPKKVPGHRGPGSKPRRSRSTAEFSKGFETVRSDRSYARTNRKTRSARKREEDRKSGRLAELRRELQEAKAAVLKGTATHEQKLLDMRADDAKFFMQRYACDQDEWDRIVRTGFVWPGGMVAGKYYRKAFVEKGLRSWRHPFFQRVVASIGRAASKTLRTGPSKSECALQWKKLPALDQPYAFFSAACRDLFRLDLDKTFKSEAHLRAWIAYIVEENDLPCGPHIIDWIPDDNFPGQVIHPQLFFLLPEGNAVWKTSDPKQHTMLGQVIAGLTRAFQCDQGGLADPFSGKNPISPLVEARVYQDTHMPMLIEYFEALDCALDPLRMFRLMSTEQLEAAGFDRSDSNTWFTSTANLANAAAQDLYKQGFPTADRDRLRKRLIKLITPAALEALKPTPAQKKTVTKLIECCARYAAENFDPTKMDARGRDRGAAAHLIEVTDSLKVKRQKGKAYSDTVKIIETRALIAKAILSELRAGREPTISSITALVPRCYNTVKQHFFACYQTAVASISLRALLRGYTNLPGLLIPSRAVLLTANSVSDVPEAWRAACQDPVIVDHFRLQALRSARSKRPAGAPPHPVSVPIRGRRALDFMSAGPVTVYRSAAVESQAA